MTYAIGQSIKIVMPNGVAFLIWKIKLSRYIKLYRAMDLKWKIKVNSKPVDFDWFKNGGVVVCNETKVNAQTA
ncbi:hypothetical protein [Lactiplantibacillus plantarum]|uniref:hypothetical protein n=1 Tax=Lactiplantibacillus plantarum TaxID=1590 RepID=UPI0013B04D63|nr:hypothetical protein [Lactiplantibacillus plantarum]